MSFAKKMARKRVKADIRNLEGNAKQMQRVRKDVRRAYVQQNYNDAVLRVETAHNVMLILMAATYRTFGFGRKRLTRVCERMKSFIDCIHKGYVKIAELCQILRDEAKMDIQDNRDHNVPREKLIQFHIIDEMSTAFLMSLLDEFGYKSKRLSKVYSEAARISEKLEDKKLQIQDVEKMLTEDVKFTDR